MRDTRPEPQDKPYGIEGIPLSPSVEFKTPENGLPFTPNMPVRREITSFYEAKDDLSQKQWTLFILALIKFKAMPVDDKFSYFQVAGIHGYPQTSWDGAEDPPKDPSDPSKIKPGEDPFGGYCKHNSINFPTWHRPYMLLFEKRLWVNMGLVIDSWKLDAATAAKWEEAKDQWRLPYWDWALKQKYTQNFALPEVFTLDKVQIYPPTGDSNPDNPLWGFVNPEKDSKGDPLPFGQMPAGKEKWSIKNNESDKDNIMPWGECSGVSRYGILRTANGGYTGLKGENRFGAANTALAASDFYNPFKDEKEKRDGEHDPEYDIWVKPGLLSDAISRMFSSEYSDTWGSFATTKWFNEERWQEEVSTGFLSLEYIHNNVHNLTGGSNFKNPSTKEDEGVGHMSDVPVAAFDPIFYMHHCNIDRLLAMWQVLNWNTWFNGVEKPQPPGHENQNLPDPTENDVLEPFHIISGKKDVWTSKMTRDWTKLHYQYDTLEPQSSAIENGTLNEVQYRKDIKKSIRATYPSTVGYVRQILRLWEEKKTREIFGPNIEGNSWNDYIINVIYDRYALFGRSYSIEFWLDGDEKDPESAFKDPVNRIGRVYSLGGLAPATNDSEGCANCGSQRDMKVLSRAQIPITIPLLSRALRDDYLKLNDIRRQHVEEYLKKYLRWRFIEHGETRDATAFKDTKIMVLRGHGMILPTDEKEDEVPQKYSGYEILYLPTEGKAGGVGKKDDKFGEDVRKNYRTLNEAPTQEQGVKH